MNFKSLSFNERVTDTKAIVGTDYLGRTNPVSITLANDAAVTYLGTDQDQVSRDGYTNNTPLYSMINQIVKAAQVIPFGLYAVNKSDSNQKLIQKHPIADLLYRPNEMQAFPDFLEQHIVQLCLTGQVLLLKTVNKEGLFAGNVQSLNIMPRYTETVGGDWLRPVTSYRVATATGAPDEFAAERVIAIKKYNPEQVTVGLSPVQAGSGTITSFKNGEAVRIKQYANNGPKQIIYHDDTNAEPLTQEQSQTLINRLKRFFGVRRGEETTVPYSTSKLGVVQLGSTPVDLDVLNSIKLDVGMLAMLLNFPPELLSTTDNATYNNTDAAHKALYNNCVIPILIQLRDKLNHELTNTPAYKDKVTIAFDLSGVDVLQENKKEVAEYLALVPYMKVNDKLKRLGETLVPEAENGYIVPIGFTYVKTLDELSEPTSDGSTDTYATDDSAVEGD